MSDSNALPNLYLMGFMGTGKSAVGRSLAAKYKLRHIDSDQEIERTEGRPIAQIFKESGETYFRDLEMKFIEGGHPGHNCVVSCGGGMVTIPGAVEKLRDNGIIICLFASPETIYERTAGNDKRPLLNVENPMARIRKLHKSREALYRDAGINISTDKRSIQEVCEHVTRLYGDLSAKHED